MSFRGTFNQKRNAYRLSCSRNLRLESLEQRNLLSANLGEVENTENTEEDTVATMFLADAQSSEPTVEVELSQSLVISPGKGKAMKEQFIYVNVNNVDINNEDGLISLREAIAEAKTTGKEILIGYECRKIVIDDADLAAEMKEVSILVAEGTFDFSSLEAADSNFETPDVETIIWVSTQGRNRRQRENLSAGSNY